MKKSLLVVLCLFAAHPLHAQKFAYDFSGPQPSEPVEEFAELAPHIWDGSAFVSINSELGTTSLFSGINYPWQAKKVGIAAECKILFEVSRKGKVKDLNVLGENCDSFTKVIQESLESKSFRPAMKNGQRVDSPVRASIRFDLE